MLAEEGYGRSSVQLVSDIYWVWVSVNTVPTLICTGPIYPRLKKYAGIQDVLHSSIKWVSDAAPAPVHPLQDGYPPLSYLI